MGSAWIDENAAGESLSSDQHSEPHLMTGGEGYIAGPTAPSYCNRRAYDGAQLAPSTRVSYHAFVGERRLGGDDELRPLRERIDIEPYPWFTLFRELLE